MTEFFHVNTISEILDMRQQFSATGTEIVPVFECLGRVLAQPVKSPENVPDFVRSTMDGYALDAASTFGASAANPALLTVVGNVSMGTMPDFRVGPGQAARIGTGGMLPSGANAVIMIELTEVVDDTMIEAYKSVAPLNHTVSPGDDVAKGESVLPQGHRLRPQDLALCAAIGVSEIPVYCQPRVAIVSTGDELVSPENKLGPGQIRDMNTYALCGLVKKAGGIPVMLGIVPDDPDHLEAVCQKGLETCDALLISGGSSVGTRDYTIAVLDNFSGSRILAHGVAVSPGKPTILARVSDKMVWGLPGNVVSAMVVFHCLVRPFLHFVGGANSVPQPMTVQAKLTRNLPSVQGRVDFVRVRLQEKDGNLYADPIFGKSGIIRTMVDADGFVEVDQNAEGIDADTLCPVVLFSQAP